jgi:hypothetical protein
MKRRTSKAHLLNLLRARLPVEDQAAAREVCDLMVELARAHGWPSAPWRAQARRHLGAAPFDDLPRMHASLDKGDETTAAFGSLRGRDPRTNRPKLRVAGAAEHATPAPRPWRPDPDAEATRDEVAKCLRDATASLRAMAVALRSGEVDASVTARRLAQQAREHLYAATASLRAGGAAMIDETRRRMDGVGL